MNDTPEIANTEQQKMYDACFAWTQTLGKQELDSLISILDVILAHYRNKENKDHA